MQLDSLLKHFKYSEAKNYVQSLSQIKNDKKALLLGEIYVSEVNLDSSFYYLLSIDTLKLTPIERGDYYNLLAKTYSANNEEDISFKNYEKAQKYYLKNNKKQLANLINYNLYNLLSGQEHYNDSLEEYLNTFETIAIKNNYLEQQIDAKIERAIIAYSKKDSITGNKHINEALSKNELLKNKSKEARIHTIKGVYMSEIFSDYSKEDYNFNKALQIQNTIEQESAKYYTYINQASVFRHVKKNKDAIQLLLKADSITPKKYRKNNKKFLYGLLSDDYLTIGDTAKALKYLKLNSAYRDSVNIASQNINLTKFQSEKKEKQIIIEQQKKEQNQNIAIGLGGGMIGVALIGFLLFKNTRRKQRIAEQQSQIEIQKTEKILKEQELTTIDAMIAGQEKERERLAGDLHDSVGATLAAAKLQFNHLKTNRGKLKNEDELFEKTSTLLEDAYTEIRNMAHIKNSGVIAKNGLLPAVEKLAKNASNTDGLKIEVQDFGLEKRLENSMEIAVFRIIQELVTNIIKHSKAKEASISITQYKDSLSIIVEDNGKGFDTKLIHAKDGLGLVNIERRVEHLEGSMEVDSTIGKGTSVLIDIPL